MRLVGFYGVYSPVPIGAGIERQRHRSEPIRLVYAPWLFVILPWS